MPGSPGDVEKSAEKESPLFVKLGSDESAGPQGLDRSREAGRLLVGSRK
jgi:hypothetical protein